MMELKHTKINNYNNFKEALLEALLNYGKLVIFKVDLINLNYLEKYFLATCSVRMLGRLCIAWNYNCGDIKTFCKLREILFWTLGKIQQCQGEFNQDFTNLQHNESSMEKFYKDFLDNFIFDLNEEINKKFL